MRKVDPNDVRNAFVSDATDLNDYFGRLRRGLAGSSHEKRDVSRLASTTFLSLYVRFENYLSDLFLAYLNRDFSTYQDWVKNRVDQSTAEKFGSWAGGRTAFSPVTHVAVAELESIVDPTGWSLTFGSASKIGDRATEWLAAGHRARVHSLTASDQDLIDTARSVRDFIAHRSPGSKKRMNVQLQVVNQHGGNPHLARGPNAIHDEGAYLKAVTGGHRRLTTYSSRLQDIALKM